MICHKAAHSSGKKDRPRITRIDANQKVAALRVGFSSLDSPFQVPCPFAFIRVIRGQLYSAHACVSLWLTPHD